MYIWTYVKAFLLCPVLGMADPHGAHPPRSLAEGLLAGLMEVPPFHTPSHSPTALGQVGVVVGHALQAAETVTKSGMHFENLMMTVCLLVVPVVLAVIAFSVMARSWSEEEDKPAPMHPRRTQPTPNSQATTAAYARWRTGNGARGAAQGMTTTSASLATVPPSLSCLTAPPSAIRPPLAERPSALANARPSCAQEPDQYLALAVQNKMGVRIQFDSLLRSRPETRTVTVLNVQDARVLLRAQANEHIIEVWCKVQCKNSELAPDVPFAILDAREASTMPGYGEVQHLPRKVVMHRVESAKKTQKADAWIVPSSGCFLVLKLPIEFPIEDEEPWLRVFVKPGTAEVESLEDVKEGQIIARSDHSVRPGTLFVEQGADLILVACICMAVQKLGVETNHQGSNVLLTSTGRLPTSSISHRGGPRY